VSLAANSLGGTRVMSKSCNVDRTPRFQVYAIVDRFNSSSTAVHRIWVGSRADRDEIGVEGKQYREGNL
jgi:hypothetical protein